MENIPVFNNRLDESNGIVENVLGMKTTAKKTPWHLRFAHKAKGIVSFVQNLLSPLTQKEASAAAVVLAGISFLKAKKAVSPVAAAVVWVGLLCLPIESAHGAVAEPATVGSVDLVGANDSTPLLFDTVVDFSDLGSWWGARVPVTSESSSSGLYQGGYVIVSFDPYYRGDSPFHGSDDGWVEVWIWMGGLDDPPVAYVYDSSNSSGRGGSGSFYCVDLYIDGYLVSGPSWYSGY